ncbi:T9SS type A sorting domain-containing protein [Fluviicola taffensis]|uniref:T9SS type A sorting domain-containing protein n=1 Tax=Fluviicola taffensis TaxID=191579 RepID=UPI0031380043
MNSPFSRSIPIFFGITSIIFSLPANAQNMNIISSNGTNQVIDLTTIESLVFKNGNMIVKDANCGDRYFSQFFVTSIDVGADAGINQLSEANGIQIYPNPVTDQITISRKQSGNTMAEITSVLGEKVAAFEVSDKTFSTSIPEMKSGVYFLNIDQQCIKFVKQ